MAQRQETQGNRLDDAARAGWLYYVAGNNQEQIARKLGVSRQTAQRLVSLSVSEGLVRVRLDHPIGRCMELAERLSERYALDFAEVVPTDPDAPGAIHGVAIAAAVQIERWLRADKPTVMAIGTGRTLKAAIEQLTPMEAPQHKIVSLTGSSFVRPTLRQPHPHPALRATFLRKGGHGPGGRRERLCPYFSQPTNFSDCPGFSA